ncbi:MAG TPA: amidohydrolase family protein, partial [Candidatus Binatia bacterium]|nr:amidohydrolase family protein [Candidatus Binatia bacterium]
MEFDVLVRGGAVWDGLGGPPAHADVGVTGGRIEEVGDLSAATGAVEVDAGGLAVAPGFIDTHTHSDMVWGLGPEHEDLAAGTIRQGVTTEVCGNCGFTPFPCLPERQADLARHAGILGGAGIDWRDLAGWSERASAQG